jgi:hypothetical protein
MPLGDVEASALQVTSGIVYETLLDCSDGTYRPDWRRAGTSPTTG